MRRAKRWGCGLLVTGAFLTAGQVAGAAGVRGLADGWLLGPGAQAAFLGSPTVPGAGIWALVGQARLYTLADLPVLGLSVGGRGARTRWVPALTLAWERLGQGLYREDSGQMTALWGTRRGIGVVWAERRLRTGDGTTFAEVAQRQWQLDFLLQGAWERGNASFRTRLQVPLTGTRDESLEPARSGLLRAEAWQGPVALALAVARRPGGAPTVGLEWQVGAGGAACGVRLDPATGVTGVILNWRRGPLLLRTSHLVHPVLGVTHRVQFGGGRWEAAGW